MSEPPMECRKRSDDVETGVELLLRDQPGGYLPTAQAASGIKAARAWLRLLRGTCEPATSILGLRGEEPGSVREGESQAAETARDRVPTPPRPCAWRSQTASVCSPAPPLRLAGQQTRTTRPLRSTRVSGLPCYYETVRPCASPGGANLPSRLLWLSAGAVSVAGCGSLPGAVLESRLGY